MRFLLLVVIVMSFTILSCDGIDKRYKSNREILQEQNLLESFSKSITYIPEAYIKTSKDTILSNGYRVKIESYTDMKNSYLKTSVKNNIQHIHYYRQIKSIIKISKQNKDILTMPVTKDNLIAKNWSLSKTLENKIIKGIWLDEYNSNMQNKVVIDILFYEPETKNTAHCSLSFDEEGQLFINDKLKEIS